MRPRVPPSARRNENLARQRRSPASPSLRGPCCLRGSGPLLRRRHRWRGPRWPTSRRSQPRSSTGVSGGHRTPFGARSAAGERPESPRAGAGVRASRNARPWGVVPVCRPRLGVASSHPRAGPQVWRGSVLTSYLRRMRTTSPYPRRKKSTRTGPSNIESGPSCSLRLPIRHGTTPFIPRAYEFDEGTVAPGPGTSASYVGRMDATRREAAAGPRAPA